MDLNSSKESLKNTVLKKYGKECYFQTEEFKEKSKSTSLKKYGTEHPSQNQEIIKKTQEAINKSKYKNNKVPSSKEQERLCNLFGCELNKLFTYYFVDGYFHEEKIYFEYNGSGHDMVVKKGKMTEEQFKAKEKRRYDFLKNIGLKEFVIINSLYPKIRLEDNDLLKLKDYAFNLLSQQGNNWVIINMDEYKIKTKKFEKNINDIIN